MHSFTKRHMTHLLPPLARLWIREVLRSYNPRNLHVLNKIGLLPAIVALMKGLPLLVNMLLL